MESTVPLVEKEKNLLLHIISVCIATHRLDTLRAILPTPTLTPTTSSSSTSKSLITIQQLEPFQRLQLCWITCYEAFQSLYSQAESGLEATPPPSSISSLFSFFEYLSQPSTKHHLIDCFSLLKHFHPNDQSLSDQHTQLHSRVKFAFFTPSLSTESSEDCALIYQNILDYLMFIRKTWPSIDDFILKPMGHLCNDYFAKENHVYIPYVNDGREHVSTESNKTLLKQKLLETIGSPRFSPTKSEFRLSHFRPPTYSDIEWESILNQTHPDIQKFLRQKYQRSIHK